MPTPVIFKLCEGEVTACFPTIPGTNDPGTMTCYAHIGQHGSASLGFVQTAKPARPEQYANLLNELRSIGYDDLVIIRRHRAAHTAARRAELRA